MFHILEFSIAVFFFLFGWIIIVRAEKSITMSAGYLRKHTKPMIIVMLLFALVASINFACYVYFYELAANIANQKQDCLPALAGTKMDANQLKFYLIIQILYRILPLWGLYWYFYSTTSTQPPQVYRNTTPRDVSSHGSIFDQLSDVEYIPQSVPIGSGKYRNYLNLNSSTPTINMNTLPPSMGNEDEFPHSMANSLLTDTKIRNMDDY
jgi:hypothetical protein